MIMLTRRKLLACCALLTSSGAVLSRSDFAQDAPVFIGATTADDGQHWVRGFTIENTSGRAQFALALPGRGHHVALHPQLPFFVAVARRPGTWLIVADTRTGNIIEQLEVPDDRHLYGHGVFTADGSRFLTTQSDFDDLEGDSGRVVVWQVVDKDGRPHLERETEFPSYGVGPHELLVMPDQNSIVIANGGLRTHPAHDRDNLNVPTMQPSLTYISLQDGALLEQQRLPEQWHQASIRHLDVNASGRVAFGMQFEGDAWLTAPLIGTHQRGEALRVSLAPEPIQGQMHQYVGSVRFANSGKIFAASCPRGNLITFWDAQTGVMVDSVRSRDGCGLCASEEGFVFTTGVGRIAYVEPGTGQVQDIELPDDFKLQWDNHLSTQL